MFEVGASMAWMRYVAGLSTKIIRRTFDTSLPSGPQHWTTYKRREAISVVASIAPWSLPIMIALWKVMPALAAGCSIVLKPSEITPLTALILAETAVEAGVPASVFNVVTGGNASFDYHGDTTQLYLRGQYAHAEKVGTNDYTDYRSRKTKRLTQMNAKDTSLRQPEDMIVGTDSKLGSIYGYTPAEIVDVDKDGRITDADRNSNQYWSLNGRSGVWKLKAFQFARSFETQDYTQDLVTVQIGGTASLDKLKLTYDVSHSAGS